MARDKEKWREYMREYARKKRAEKRSEIHERLGGSCIECGSIENLQVDHVDSDTKSMQIADMLLHSDEKLKLELLKCQLLCYDCHREKSLKENDFIPKKYR